MGLWSSTKALVRLSAQIPAADSGRPYGWNDMDMLQSGNYEQAAHANGKAANMTATEYRTEFAMWAISASPLVVTTPIMICGNESTNFTNQSGYMPGHMAPTPSPQCPPPKCPANPPKGKCRGQLNEVQKTVLLNTEVISINQDDTPQGFPVAPCAPSRKGPSGCDLTVW